MDDLIPGLPEDLARECLVRMGFDQLPVARRVSRHWKAEVESPFYHRLCRTRPLIVLSQARPPLAASGPAHKYAASATPASYRLVLHDPAAGTWAEMPPPPGGGGLPLFCQLAAVGEGPRTKLVVLGGWDPKTWTPTGAVHVYDFLAGSWRRGAEMPAPRRSFFACASSGPWVFVAGGHDAERNALRSALAYDAEADAWAALSDMARERDEARGVCAGGAFVVLGGYPTEAQGRFAGSGEAFDPVAWSWGPVREGVIEDGACPRTCCAAPREREAGSRMYMVRDGHVVARDDGGDAWRPAAKLPEDARVVTAVAAIGDGRVVVIGSACYGAEQAVHVLREDAPTPSWVRQPSAPEFAGHVQAACCVHV
jgi:hypothetical protein